MPRRRVRVHVTDVARMVSTGCGKPLTYMCRRRAYVYGRRGHEAVYMTEQRPCGTSRYRTWLYGSHQHHHELFWSDDGHPSNIRGEGRRFPVGRTRAGKMAGTVRSVRACRNH